jgi:hypothetical protein
MEVYRDGRVNHVLTTKMAWREGVDGKILGTFGISRDMGELFDAQQKCEAIIENAKEMIYTRKKEVLRGL